MGFYTKNAGLVGSGPAPSRQAVYNQEFNRLNTAAANQFDSDLISWTNDTFFDNWTSQSGVTLSNNDPTNDFCWQLYFSHQALTVSADGQNRLGLNTYLNGNNSWTWWLSLSTVDNTLGSFSSPQQATNNVNFTYATGGFNSSPMSTTLTIPANRYFLIGISTGPYYKTFRTLLKPRTAVIGSTPYLTVLRTVYYATHNSGLLGIPSQLGGPTNGYLEFTDRVMVSSIRFTG